MCEVTKRAMLALVNADDTATVEERKRIEVAIKGEFEPLKVYQAAKRLGVTKPTIYAMVRAGKLTRLANGRICGRSVADYFANNRANARRAVFFEEVDGDA